MENKIIAFLFLCFNITLQAQQIPEPKVNLIDYEKLKFLNTSDEMGSVSSNKSKELQDLEFKVETLIHPDFIYNLATNIPIKKQNIQSGEILLLSFSAKTISANLETGEARSLWLLNVSENPREKVFNTVSISSEWQQYYLPVELRQDVKAKDLKLVLQYGFPPQEFLLKNISLHLYDKQTDISALPKTKVTYAGMEAEALWRKAALNRIEKNRKGKLEVMFTRDGKGVADVPIQIELKRHHFGWGAGIDADEVLNTPDYLRHFSKAFNLAVFRNDLKIKRWSKPKKREITLAAIDLVANENIDIKGHVLIWPGFRYLTPNFRKNKNNPAKITNMMENHVADILKQTDGKVNRWDVVNEAYTNRDLQEITGSEEILYNGFRAVAKQNKKTLCFTNEYGIISKGGLDQKKQQWYYEYIKRVDKETDGLVDGIGVQCHMGSDLTPPEKVLDLLNYYGQLKKKISISEFTMEVKDPEVRKQYTKDFMTAAFSHPSVSEFLFWGFQWEKADIFTDDWRLGIMGEAFYELVHKEWKTKITKTTNRKGCLEDRGFYGTYEYTYIDGDEVKKGTFDLLPGGKKHIKVELR